MSPVDPEVMYLHKVGSLTIILPLKILNFKVKRAAPSLCTETVNCKSTLLTFDISFSNHGEEWHASMRCVQ